MNEVVVFGASGYSGLELLRLLAWHPAARVSAASSDRWAGRRVDDAVAGWRSDLAFSGHDDTLARAREGQVAILATPATTSVALAPALLDRGLRVIDVSGAFRLRSAAAYPEWYGFEHPRPDLLEEATYGLPELLPAGTGARLIANPGCYATAAILAVAPLVQAGLLLAGAPIVLDGKSGTTGAGRSANEALLHAEVTENLRAYRLLRHQHTPEIEQALQDYAAREVRVSFTAHLIPMRRGILLSAYGVAAAGVDDAAVAAAYRDRYAVHPFVRWVDRPPETARVRDHNHVEVHACVDPRTGTVMAFAAIDNLGKGAAGQAVQNLNRMLGLPSEHGLLPASEAVE